MWFNLHIGKFRHSYITMECGRFTHHIGKTSRHNGIYVGTWPEGGSHRRVEVHAKPPLVRVNPTFKYLEFPMWSPLWWLDLPMWYPKLHSGDWITSANRGQVDCSFLSWCLDPPKWWLIELSWCQTFQISQCGGWGGCRHVGNFNIHIESLAVLNFN